VSNMYY